MEITILVISLLVLMVSAYFYVKHKNNKPIPTPVVTPTPIITPTPSDGIELYYNKTKINCCCNGIINTYYMNSGNFKIATHIYNNKEKTILAPTGYYANGQGSGSNIRHAINGVFDSFGACKNCE